MDDKNGILLESGTNEIEIMEFTIAGNLYGINVAKVREIMLSEPVKQMPHTHNAVEGIFKPRDVVLTVVNLPRYLGADGDPKEKDLFIITNFNKMNIAFRVHTVVGISRISWAAIQKPDKATMAATKGWPRELPSAAMTLSPSWILKRSWRKSRRKPLSRYLRSSRWAIGTGISAPC